MTPRQPFKENVVQHTRTIEDENGVSAGVLVSLTILSTSPLAANAYPAIAEATAAVDALADVLRSAVPSAAQLRCPDCGGQGWSREMGCGQCGHQVGDRVSGSLT